MTAADWLTGAIATAMLALAVVRRIRTAGTRRDRERRELRRSAARFSGVSR